MTQGTDRIFDDFARLMTDAAGLAQGARREAEAAFRSQVERLLHDMDLVSREDHEAVKEMAANARSENEALKAQISELEKRVAALEGGAKPAPKKRASPSSTKK